MQDLNYINFPANLPLTSWQVEQLKSQLMESVGSADLFRLSKRATRFSQSTADAALVTKEWQGFQDAVARSQGIVQSRQKNLPKIQFPDLPVSARSEEIRQLIEESQVVIIAGETGSGKTTQIPKICLQAGRGVKGIIGHTQPRRIAARTVAQRIAEELESPLGKAVGYKVRFSDQTSSESYIKLMTDGILLAEIQQDRFLSKYDTLIIDEAHERSLNIDFLLGYLKTLLVQRQDLKLIITSATIDIQKFSAHFNDAPIVEVSGRTYPVDIVYSDLDILDGDRNQQIVDCLRDIQDRQQQGDVLVFLSGEREIREASLALRRAQFRDTEIVPLYARLSLSEQSKIFAPHRGRRVILSTNVAETSLTVPGIRYVIDTGRARVSRYSFRTKVQRLPIESISQASANQRAGRCGRVSDGLCYRLYRQDDFESRSRFTDPEIIRTNLAAVILQMLQLQLGDIRNFPFIDPPDNRLINDGYKLLEELQAVTADGRLTSLGKKLVTLPVDPRFARMILESDKNGSLRELIIITSGLSIQDPRERPGDKQQAADQAHKQWVDENSDFVSLLNLWNHFEEKRSSLSTNQYSTYCRLHYVSFVRMREWRDLHHQLHNACRVLALKKNQIDADYASIHCSLLSGLLGQVGIREEKWEFSGTRNRKFFIFPGSGLTKKPPKWVMAGSLMETTKQYALNVAKIDSAWLESLAAHLVKKTHSEPFYHQKSGQVMASERQTLFGLSIVEGKKVVYGNVSPSEARKVFIQQALVEDGYRAKGEFYAHNHALVSELQALEDRFRRRDLLAEQMVIYSHYDERIPSHVYNLPAFEKWRKTAEKADSKLLFISKESLLLRGLSDSEEAQFPELIGHKGLEFELRYHFEPGHPKDGVSLFIPLAVLHQLPHYFFQWLVPGMLRDKCIALIKGLPKQVRRQFVPVPDYIDKVLSNVSAQDRPLTLVLSEQLHRLTGTKIEESSWNVENIDNWYLMNFVLQDDKGQMIAMARSLHQLQRDFKQQIKQSLDRPSEQSIARKGILEWDFEQLPLEVELPRGEMTIKAWPALQDNGESASIELVDNPLVAEQISRHGQLRLALLRGREQHKYLLKNLLKGKELALKAAGLGPREELVVAIIEASFQQAIFTQGTVVRDREGFERRFSAGISQVVDIAQQHGVQVASVLTELHEQQKRLRGLGALGVDAQLDISVQVKWLFSSETLRRAKPQNTQQYPRFVKGISIRIDKLTSQAVKDREHIAELRSFAIGVEGLGEKQLRLTSASADLLLDFQWLLEEYRVSLFAQQLKTRSPVSAKRLAKKWSDIVDQLNVLLPDYH